MKTKKLYESDGMLARFPARVLSCRPYENGYAAVLDRTAFFPEGGGQTADTGTIGSARVFDVQIRDGEILHFTDAPVSGEVTCALDFDVRFRKMQNHLGEHLLCGAFHRLYGLDNVGFHLGADYMTFDIDGILTPEQIAKAEKEANRAVFEDVPVRCWYPEKDELAVLDYRAKSEKLEAAEGIRIVEAAGFDRCACCAPHLDRTGRIGCIKITDAAKYKGGMRLHALCGSDALADYGKKQAMLETLSHLFSAEEDRIVQAAEARLAELSAARQTAGAYRRALVGARLAALSDTEGSICLFEPLLDTNGLRELAASGAHKTAGIFAAFSGTEEAGYDFVLASERIPLGRVKEAAAAALGAKCGGSDNMLFGHADADKAAIRRFFEGPEIFNL